MRRTPRLKSLGSSSITAVVIAVSGVTVMNVNSASAAVLTWDSGGASPAAPVDGSGNWNSTNTFWSNATSDVAWGTTNSATATFGSGGSGTATVEVVGNLTASGGLSFQPGASYIIDIAGNATANTNKLTISGANTITVADNVSAKITGSAGTSPTTLVDMTLSGPQTWNVGNNATLEVDVRYNKAGTSPSLTKTGNGLLILGGVNNGGSGSVSSFPYTVSAGTLRIANTNAALGNSGNSITVANGATLELTSVGYNQANGTTTLNGTGVGGVGALHVTGGTNNFGSATNTGTFVLSSASTGIGVDSGASFTTLRPITGAAGGLTKLGGGVFGINSTSTYTGATTITAGTLAIGSSGTISNSTGIDIQTGATFDVSALGTYSLASAQTLKGVGSINGSITDLGILAPGETGIGTLTTNNALSLAGTSNFEIDKSAGNALSTDLVTGITALTEGGALNVSFLNSASNPLAAGDSFTLFNAGSISGSFSSINLPTLDPSLTWDTSNLATTGTIAVTSAAAVPEPASLSIFVLGGAALLTRRRK